MYERFDTLPARHSRTTNRLWRNRLFVALDTTTRGGATWLRAHNLALRDTLLEATQTPRGLALVSQYLEARLARA